MPPQTRSKRTTPTRTLPSEILRHVFSFLDPIRDGPTLAAAMRASSALWEAAAQQLYTNLAVDTLEFLLSSAFSTSSVTSIKPHSRHKNRVLTPRARRALAMTRRLVLGPEEGCAKHLVGAQVMGGPLFPNLTSLVLVNESNRTLERHADDYAPNIELFDRPDMCIKSDIRTICRLGVRRAQTLAFHGYPADSVLNGYQSLSAAHVFPETWDEFRVYDVTASYSALENLPDLDQAWKDAGFPAVKVRFDLDDKSEAFKGHTFESILEDKDMGPCKLCGQS